ncbi:hypothetical protein D3C76_1616250 [compost metagenome]
MPSKIHLFRIHHRGFVIIKLQCAELLVAAQALIEQRLLLFNQLRFQQQRPYFTRRPDKGDTPGLAQHGRFVWSAQM